MALMDTLEKCSSCGSGICLAQSRNQGKPNWCFTNRRLRENEKACPTCNTKVPVSAIQNVKGGKR